MPFFLEKVLRCEIIMSKIVKGAGTSRNSPKKGPNVKHHYFLKKKKYICKALVCTQKRVAAEERKIGMKSKLYSYM